MSENDELARLRGEVDALKDALVVVAQAARALDSTQDLPGTKKVVGVLLRYINSEISGRPSTHIPDVVSSQPEVRAAYTKDARRTEKVPRGKVAEAPIHLLGK